MNTLRRLFGAAKPADRRSSLERYRPEREVTERFIQTVGSWIDGSGEVLVELRYLRGAGSRDFALCRSRSSFEALVDCLRVGTAIEVYRRPKLTLRGIADGALVSASLKLIGDDQEYLVLTRETVLEGPISSTSRSDVGHDNLRDDLADMAGLEVAVGVFPSWSTADDVCVSAAKGGIDGPR